MPALCRIVTIGRSLSPRDLRLSTLKRRGFRTSSRHANSSVERVLMRVIAPQVHDMFISAFVRARKPPNPPAYGH